MNADPAALTQKPRRRSGAGAMLLWLWRFYVRVVRVLSSFLFGTLLVLLGVLFINYVVLSTPKNRAYRNLDPASPVCAEGLVKGWTALGDVGRGNLGNAMSPNDGGWFDVSNDELAVVGKDPAWNDRLRCSLQHHVVPATQAGAKPLDYDLGFLEFQEDGEPYALVASGGKGRDLKLTSSMLQNQMETRMRTQHRAATALNPVITQLDVLKQHLATGSHYVIVFIHGWRNDAQIGNGNVADLRLYAAHAAKFLQQRCPVDPGTCDMKVTAIYVGWRGARVDEKGLKDYFGETLGGFLGGLSAGATLFDRKPVSEAIAPAAISALRTLESTLSPQRAPGSTSLPSQNRMVVVGHSLGGNMLATGLKDDVVKAVKRHRFGDVLPPVLGNLVLLVNPASEATKWTTIQREVWNGSATHTDAHTSAEDVARDNGTFPPEQRPVMVSVTAALAFPAGGLRSGDCAWIGLDIDDGFQAARERIRKRLAATDGMFASGIDYDWATHDLFPAFKFDFRPGAGFLDRLAARIEGRQPPGQNCAPRGAVDPFDRLKTLPIRALSMLAQTFPFQDFSREESHTIGNLDPPRPAAGLLADALPSAAPFGTTHELLGLHAAGEEQYHPYATLADAEIDCPVANRWLTRARAKQAQRYGMFWDSEDLGPPVPGVMGQGKPAAEFLHGLQLTGIAPITRANDPFWNVRAFDNALSRHDGYRLTSFICAMNQLVMDEITEAPNAMMNVMVGPNGPAIDNSKH